MLIELASIILVYVAYLAFAARRLLTYLHAFQQEEYDEGRFLAWVYGRGAFDKRMSFLIILIGAASITSSILFYPPPAIVTALCVFVAFSIVTKREKDPRFDSKKKLVMTTRAKRIIFVAFIYAAMLGSWIFFTNQPLFWLIPIHLLPFVLGFANITLMPFEAILQAKYWNEARIKINEVSPTIIAITGSFGKTSVKHILGHILKANASTLITPGSVNTPMGISRIIREELDETHRYFIVEMGAYGLGSIGHLCKLTPPNLGIITAVGHAHFERFRSLTTVAQTKFELAEHLIQNDNKIIVNEKALQADNHGMKMQAEHRGNFIICGDDQNNNVILEDVRQSVHGMELRIRYHNTLFIVEAPLFGTHHALNIALAFAAARALDIPAEKIKTALKSLPQIPHRLEVKKTPGGGTIIDDSYNSNPLGFRSALDLLAVFNPNQRKILVTPGIVELGSAHNEVHKKLGQYAAEICDVVIVVNGERIPTFISGFKSKAEGKIIQEVKTFADAQSWLDKNKQNNDIVLIENDLPDIYESKPKT